VAQAGSGAGLAAVETARGVLIHWALMDGGQVARYRIVAPTEWNFHPQGAFVRGLAGIPARDEDEVRQAAALLAHALDPCVAYDLKVKHA
jgi:Ni,Fe-hydrogenase I large subunit